MDVLHPGLLAIMVCITLLASPAFSATINVTANATDTLYGADAQCSLREAITNINNGATTYADCAPTGAYGTSDTINIPAGTYTGSGYNLNISVSIVGAGASSTIINGGGAGKVFLTGISVSGSIYGVTITGGATPADHGSAITNTGTLSVTNSIISGNTAGYNGGAINNIGTLTVTNSTISGNSALGIGGGIWNQLGTVTVTNSTISGNSSGSNGGGIFISAGTVSVTNSTISGNSASGSSYGGGIHNSGGTLTITNSTISGNTATTFGGGIFNGMATVTITNSTISGNSAANGGGIYSNGIGTLNLSNSIVANPTSGGNCVGGSITSNGYNLSSDASCGFTGTGDLQNTNPLLGALANNGGLTQTMALSPGSPARDAGTCTQATDQRGTARPQGVTCDIGAYEDDGPLGYLLTATAGTGGSVTPAIQGVVSGSTASFTVTPNTGYTTNTPVGGTCVTGSWNGTTYTTGAVTGTCTVSFAFTLNSYTVSATAGTGGAISPPSQAVNHGSTTTFTVTPNTGYSIGSVSGCGGSLNGTTYTTGVITGPCTVSATFTINSYAVTATAGPYGWISPASQMVNHGSTTTFTVTPIPGYVAYMGGTCGGALVGTTYTTNPITAPCAVSVTFVAGGSLKVAISPDQAVADGARWSVDGGATWNSSGATLTGLSAGSQTLSFNTVTGWSPPASQTVSITLGQTTNAAGAYTAVTGSASSLTVNISPAGAVTAGARWSVDGGAWQASDAIVNSLTAGRHVVSFNTVTGHTSPSNQTVSLTLGVTTALTGRYIPVGGSGELTVNISPASAVTAGAQWSLDGGSTWNASGDTVTGLTAGSHTVSFSDVVNYTSPNDKVVNIADGDSGTVTGSYKQDGSLTVTISPQEAVTNGADWSVDGGTTWYASGDTAYGLGVGRYILSFSTAVTGYSPPGNKIAIISSGQNTVMSGTYTPGYKVLSKASTGGTATPSTITVTGGTVTFTVTPSLRYTTNSIVGGTCAPGSWSGTSYTTDVVTEACTVNFTFTKAPTVSTGSATNIMQTVATLNAKVNPENSPTTVTFEYGLGLTYGSTVSAAVLTRGVKQSVAAPVTGLQCGMTYHFRVAASNANPPTQYGYDRTFKTAACLVPTATTLAASGVTQTGATLKGVVNPNKASTAVTFEYVANQGTTAPSTYGSTVSYGVLAAGASKLVSVAVTGLTCNTKYHFRVTAANANPPTTNGQDRVFTTSACTDRAPDSNMVKAIVSDFDGDGKSDIVFRDATSGQTAVWMMNGASVTSNALTSMTAGAYTSTAGWQAQGIGDFDGDGKNDLLWRDAESGQLAVWTMNGADVVTSANTSVNPSAGWLVQGVGDFNGDGKSDILFRHVTSGETSIWFMNGAVRTGARRTSSTAGAYTSTTGWQVHGVGDFNGDGKSDILWRQIGTGRTAIWFMNGATVTNRAVTTVQAGAYTSTSGWQIHGVGDFNGDGKADILWRNAESGATVVWFMNGVKRTGRANTSVQLGAYTSTSGWQIQAVGDFNGDGKSDVLLRYAGTGQTYIWLMNGAVVTGDWTSVSPGAYDSTTGLQILSEETIR